MHQRETGRRTPVKHNDKNDGRGGDCLVQLFRLGARNHTTARTKKDVPHCLWQMNHQSTLVWRGGFHVKSTAKSESHQTDWETMGRELGREMRETERQSHGGIWKGTPLSKDAVLAVSDCCSQSPSSARERYRQWTAPVPPFSITLPLTQHTHTHKH